ncbi:MAG TPA: sigma-70 family RNA polymerase sigma factor [Bryobacteraceae bacterium]|nr:sigma-70 family RNA polymerase sigma factor [Bryobacteraceae bacterium]
MGTLDEAIEQPAIEEETDFESVFHRHYDGVFRAVARIVRDAGRAEEIAAETFWRFWRAPKTAHAGNAAGWLYKTAIRLALDDLKREARRLRRETAHTDRLPAPTPEQAHAASEERDRVRLILTSLDPRQAELLLLRHNDLSYAEIATALALNPASIGTLISRAQQAFRREYVKHYGEPNHE